MGVETYLRRQAGVISHEQAVAAGTSRSAVHRRVTGGQWILLHPRGYLAADRERTDEVRLRGAVLWAGPGAVAHGESAAVALGAAGSVLLDRALQQRVDFGWVHRAHCHNLGRHGSAAASALLVAAADRAASHAERLLVRLLDGAGIAGWTLGYPWHGYLIDLAFPAQRIAIEVDGWAWHVTPERFVRDRQRQNAMVNGRWHVLRLSWHDLTGRPIAVIGEIRRALAK